MSYTSCSNSRCVDSLSADSNYTILFMLIPIITALFVPIHNMLTLLKPIAVKMQLDDLITFIISLLTLSFLRKIL